MQTKEKKKSFKIAQNHVFTNYKNMARRRGYDFALSREYFNEITSKPCFYCGKPPSRSAKPKRSTLAFIYTGIDRIDNCKGYILGNCVPCCKECNYIKSDVKLNELDLAINIFSKLIYYKNSSEDYSI